MIPLLVIAGATFLSTFTARGIARAVINRRAAKRASSSKTDPKDSSTTRELDETLEEERKIDNPERNADHVEDAERDILIDNLKEFVKVLQSVLENKDVTSIAKAKIDSSLNVGDSKIDNNNKELLAYVESVIKNKWNNEVSKATDEANILIDELNNGADIDDVISKFPSVSIFEDFVDELEKKENFVFDAKRRFSHYYGIREYADDVISHLEKDDPRIKEINDICDSLKKERDNVSVTNSDFKDLGYAAYEKIDDLFNEEKIDEEEAEENKDLEETEENKDLEETEFDRTKELLNQAKEQLRSNKTNIWIYFSFS